MDMTKELEKYLEYCQYRKELNANTIKAYRIDLKQYLAYVRNEITVKAKIEEYSENMEEGRRLCN